MWLARAASFDPPTTPGLSPAASLGAVAHGAGLDAIAAAQGLPPARQAACLASKPELDRLGQMRFEAWTTRNIQGTPAFFIGGVDQGVSDWAHLRPEAGRGAALSRRASGAPPSALHRTAARPPAGHAGHPGLAITPELAHLAGTAWAAPTRSWSRAEP